MWRRVAGGLLPEQQDQLLARILPLVQKKPAELFELLRAGSALESASPALKTDFGTLLLRMISGRPTPANEQACLALARLCARLPLSAGGEHVLPARIVNEWFEKLFRLDWDVKARPVLIQCAALALRFTADPARDLPLEAREYAVGELKKRGATAAQTAAILDYLPPDTRYRSQLFGEELPAGLRLIETAESTDPELSVNHEGISN
jgi:hypothetical protein